MFSSSKTNYREKLNLIVIPVYNIFLLGTFYSMHYINLLTNLTGGFPLPPVVAALQAGSILLVTQRSVRTVALVLTHVAEETRRTCTCASRYFKNIVVKKRHLCLLYKYEIHNPEVKRSSIVSENTLLNRLYGE